MTALYLPLSDPPHDVARRLDDIRTHGYAPGVYMAWNWDMFAGLTGREVAELVHSRVALVSPTMKVRVQFDIEVHDPVLISETLERWRALRPAQDTSWTLESMQGGWMTPEFVKKIVALRVRVVPQYYHGNMDRVAEDVALKDLLARGFPYALVTGFYDARALPANWDGWAFTMGRLP